MAKATESIRLCQDGQIELPHILKNPEAVLPKTSSTSLPSPLVRLKKNCRTKKYSRDHYVTFIELSYAVKEFQ